MKFIDGGVCAPKGFKASGIYCGIRKNKTKKDLALIVSSTKAQAACVYTTNKVKGSPIIITKKNVSDGYARAIICNSGNANTCNYDGEEKAQAMCDLVSSALNIDSRDVVVASTGVIGQVLPIEPIKQGINDLVSSLSENGSDDASQAIMTTDLIKKEVAVEFEIDGVKCTIGAIAKGSGMIHPNMATMLAFITSDVCVSANMLQKALSSVVTDTFNMVSVDGDTSTNDMVSILANGLANNKMSEDTCESYEIFKEALLLVSTTLSKMIAKDGEGATKLLECRVSGGYDDENAKIIAKSIITSSLLKAAMFGCDANWGRVLCAIGYANAIVDINKVSVSFISKNGEINVCKNGSGVDFDEDLAKKILQEDEIIIDIHLLDGSGVGTSWGCDLTYDYVKINGDYRT